MESSNLILFFLKKMRLEKHYDVMISNSFFKLNSIDDFQYVLKNSSYLVDIGLSSAEINRFKRMYEKAMKEAKVVLQNTAENLGKEKFISKTELKIELKGTESIIKKEILDNSYIEFRNNSPIFIKYRLLTKNNILAATIENVNFTYSYWKTLRYFQLIKILTNKIEREFWCPSVELYHSSGYPLVSNPFDYFKFVEDLLHWRYIKIIYILPKNINHNIPKRPADSFIITPSATAESNLSYIPIALYGSEFETELEVQSTNTIYVIQLINSASKCFHLPESCLFIYLKRPNHTLEKNLTDNTAIPLDNILQKKILLYLFVPSYFWKETEFYNAFSYNNYSPIKTHSPRALVYFNAILLYLVRDAILRDKLDIVRCCLGTLRHISCFPPLVYSLWLLFSKQSITLPLKIAIIEGFITTMDILHPDSRNDPLENISSLWPYLEKQTNIKSMESEKYEVIDLSQGRKGITLTEDLLDHRFLNSFPNYSSTIILWKEYEYHYREFPKSINEFASFITNSFDFIYVDHPIQIYENFILNKHSNCLIEIPFQNELHPCVFLGRSSLSYKMFDCYSPLKNETYSFDPLEINTPKRHYATNLGNYSKILIILDVSNSMNTLLNGNKFTLIDLPRECMLTFQEISTALILIDIIVDTLIGSNLKYLLGITLVSNEHNFEDGYFELVPLTLEYCYSYKKLLDWVKKILQ